MKIRLPFFSGSFHRLMVKQGYAYPSWQECHEVLSWVSNQLLPGAELELILPTHLSWLSYTGTVQAICNDEHRNCILLKQTVGWKGNFTGMLCCDGLIKPGEIIHGFNAEPDYVSMKGSHYFNELYIKKYIDDQLLIVYFDLN